MLDKRILTTIAQVANEYGIDVNYMLTMAHIESNFNPKAFNKGSKASGLYQFIPSTARAYGLTNPFDPLLAARAAARLTIANKSYIEKHNIPTTGPYLYLAHQQGCGGLVAIYNAAYRNKALSSSLRRNIDCNGGKNKTPAQFIEFWIQSYSKKSKTAMETIQSIRL